MPVLTSQMESNAAQIARQFSHQAHRYDEHAIVQKHIAHDLLRRVELVSGTFVDIGCGTGRATQALHQFSPNVIGIDLSMGMLQQAQIQAHCENSATSMSQSKPRTLNWVCGDAQSLPIQTASVDGVFSSMALQWCMPIEQAFSEVMRVIKAGGRAWLGLMIDGSFNELDTCWATICGQSKVNSFVSTQDLQNLPLSYINAKVSLETTTYTTWHPNLSSLLKSITRVGAGLSTSASLTPGLTKAQFRKIEQMYYSDFATSQGLPLSYHVAFIEVKK